MKEWIKMKDSFDEAESSNFLFNFPKKCVKFYLMIQCKCRKPTQLTWHDFALHTFWTSVYILWAAWDPDSPDTISKAPIEWGIRPGVLSSRNPFFSDKFWSPIYSCILGVFCRFWGLNSNKYRLFEKKVKLTHIMTS